MAKAKLNQATNEQNEFRQNETSNKYVAYVNEATDVNYCTRYSLTGVVFIAIRCN